MKSYLRMIVYIINLVVYRVSHLLVDLGLVIFDRNLLCKIPTSRGITVQKM